MKKAFVVLLVLAAMGLTACSGSTEAACGSTESSTEKGKTEEAVKNKAEQTEDSSDDVSEEPAAEQPSISVLYTDPDNVPDGLELLYVEINTKRDDIYKICDGVEFLEDDIVRVYYIIEGDSETVYYTDLHPYEQGDDYISPGYFYRQTNTNILIQGIEYLGNQQKLKDEGVAMSAVIARTKSQRDYVYLAAGQTGIANYENGIQGKKVYAYDGQSWDGEVWNTSLY